MENINAISNGKIKYEQFIKRLNNNQRLKHIECNYISTLYSPCWIFKFEIGFKLPGVKTAHTGCLSGVDELNLTPGLIDPMPQIKVLKVDKYQIIPYKLTTESAEEIAWNYSKKWVIRKNKILFAVPMRQQTKTLIVHKALYILKFHNRKLDQTLYKVLDSLTGDIDNLLIG